MKDDFTQQDLSHLTLKDMTAAQRAEMKRRFETFVANFVPSGGQGPERNKKVRKWVPGMKA